MNLPLEPWLGQARQYCASQERSGLEVLTFLQKKGCPPGADLEILHLLQADNYQHEQRFAAAFARDKLKLNGWGPLKIRQALRMKGVPEEYVATALASLEADDRAAKVLDLLKQKLRQLKPEDPQHWPKAVRYLLGRGFSYDEIQQARQALEALE